MKSMVLFSLGLSIMLLSCCAAPSKSLVGEYRSDSGSKLTRQLDYILFSKGRTTGSTLILNADSSFTETSCGNIIIGKWENREYELFLQPTSNRYKIDSLNVGKELSTEPIVYQIKGQKLVRFFSITESEKKDIEVFERLKKIPTNKN